MNFESAIGSRDSTKPHAKIDKTSNLPIGVFNSLSLLHLQSLRGCIVLYQPHAQLL